MKPALVAAALLSMGVVRQDDGSELREDAGETLFLSRQLEHIRSETYKVEYEELKIRQFFPVDTSVPVGANTYTYRIMDLVTDARVISNYGDDLVEANVIQREATGTIKSFGNSYSYSIQDIRAAAFARMPLDASKADAAKQGHELAFNEVGAFGLPDAGLLGVLNHPDIPEISPVYGAWATGPKTPLQIKKDLHNMAYQTAANTKFRLPPDTILLDPAAYNIVATTPMSDTNPMTILKAFLEADPYIKNVDQWTKLSAAGTPSGTRAMCYRRDPKVIQLIESQGFEQLPTQTKNLSFKVPCHSRFGGADVKQPKACSYTDGF